MLYLSLVELGCLADVSGEVVALEPQLCQQSLHHPLFRVSLCKGRIIILV